MRFNKRKYAEEYDARMIREGYPGELVEMIINEIEASQNNKSDQPLHVLDIGAGTGLFSIPLSEHGYNVSAVEPSPEMIRIFRKKIYPDISDKISIIQSDWESAPSVETDVLISIHSIYGMKNIQSAILKMNSVSSKSMLLVKSDESITLSSIIRESLKMKTNYTDFYQLIIDMLKLKKIQFNIKKIRQSRLIQFNNMQKESEYFCSHLNIGLEAAETIKQLLLKETKESNGVYSFNSIYVDNLIVF